MKRVAALISAIFALTLSDAASATIVTREFSFSATDFDYFLGTTAQAPFDPATGTVRVTFDDALKVRTARSVSFSNFNFSTDAGSFYAPAYDFDPANPIDGPVMTIGLALRGPNNVLDMGDGGNVFLLFIVDPAGAARQSGFEYSQANFDNIAFANTVTLTSSAVPEPAGWLMMIAGLGLTAAALRQRRLSALRRA